MFVAPPIASEMVPFTSAVCTRLRDVLGRHAAWAKLPAYAPTMRGTAIGWVSFGITSVTAS